MTTHVICEERGSDWSCVACETSVLCPESVPQAPMLRLTKCKDSEDVVTMHFTKKVCTLGAENVHKSKYDSVWWVTVNT